MSKRLYEAEIDGATMACLRVLLARVECGGTLCISGPAPHRDTRYTKKFTATLDTGGIDLVVDADTLPQAIEQLAREYAK